MRQHFIPFAIVLVLSAAACQRESDADRVSGVNARAATNAHAAVSAPPPVSTVRVPYSLSGLPGPWWRDNAMREEFQVDQQACRDASSAARRTATGDARKDAAYRAFLDCMTDRDWTRGFPPPRDGRVEHESPAAIRRTEALVANWSGVDPAIQGPARSTAWRKSR